MTVGWSHVTDTEAGELVCRPLTSDRFGDMEAVFGERGVARLGAGALGSVVDHGVERGVELLDAADRGLDELDGGDLPGAHEGGLGRGVECGEVVHRLRAPRSPGTAPARAPTAGPAA